LSSVAQPELAGRITGMLIEQDKSQVVAMLSSPELLQNKVEECVQLLQEQQTIKTKAEDQEALAPGLHAGIC
jgi:hypothetical protein